VISRVERQFHQRKAIGNLRTLSKASSLVDFASNDYLGLAKSTLLKGAVLEEWQGLNFNIGSTGSRLLTGNSSYAEEVENQIAQFHGYEAALLFNCGYMANVGLISGLMNEEETVFFDAQIHASVRDGICLSRVRAFPFRHNDLNHLENRLKHHRGDSKCYIYCESIYSMDGSLAPLVEICRLSKQYGAFVIVDEAHSIGVWGPQGRGLVAECNLMDQVYAQIVTFGKALGAYGAAVLGSDLLKQYLINFARSCVYTTALPFHALATIKCAYDLLPKLNQERLHIRELIRSFEGSSQTPIQSFRVSGNEAAKSASEYLAKNGFDVRALLSPTVQKGKEILRICLHAFNTESQILQLKEFLKKWRRE
jgi:8-amino-7-oxononanoate synthase